jgi:NAD(P)-dependent dehydrogenase (short-subunit alcohol dehydrogenase family)
MNASPPGTVLISGANRGIGAEFVRQYVKAGWRVIATCRDPAGAFWLTELGPAILVLPLQADDKDSVASLALALKGVPIDVLIANAGVGGPRGMEPETVDRESWIEVIQVNTIAPLALAGALRANLEKGKGKKLIAISSRLGSMEANLTGGLYVYRSSKAALNAVWRSLAIDWRPSGMVCVVLHPGWVRTDMGGKGADIGPEESVEGMRQVIDGLTLEDSGRFFEWNGRELPW